MPDVTPDSITIEGINTLPDELGDGTKKQFIEMLEEMQNNKWYKFQFMVKLDRDNDKAEVARISLTGM